ncbi:hypothetical protein [Pseudomonas aeruginosa]|uniref:hypothetical protein n=1 Tax=Pseudomonas aeruginosa TaxID=287 RepID=UPI00295E71E2|nr:hypothetical protein [Pseudomonas aeruginosa]WOU04431.1 hypothetical protein R5015_33445 [Pseudomonas aeruginosa]
MGAHHSSRCRSELKGIRTDGQEREGGAEFVARDYVYTGRRLLKSGKMGAEVIVVVNGALGERCCLNTVP